MVNGVGKRHQRTNWTDDVIHPPKPFWEVPGHENCISRIFPSGQACLPATRPPKCIPPAWEMLQHIEKCPNPIPNPNCYPGFKEEIKNLKEEMVAMQLELTKEIQAQSKRCTRPIRYSKYGTVGQWNQYRRPSYRHKNNY